MSFAVSAVVSRAGDLLYDPSHIRWTEDELVRYCDDAQKVIVAIKPHLNTVVTNVALSAGTRQTLPSDCMRLLRVTRNRGSAGSTNGKSIRIAYMEVLDANIPDWHATTTTSRIEHYVYDNAVPEHFYVYPGMGTGSLYVEIQYFKRPAAIATVSDSFEIGDENLPIVLDYVMFRAFEKDAEFGGNPQRAATHRLSFAQALNIQSAEQWALVGARNKPAGLPPDESQISPTGQ